RIDWTQHCSELADYPASVAVAQNSYKTVSYVLIKTIKNPTTKIVNCLT
ncbi:hypothetical protein CCACVL1_00735, partial [Corchorus capsularis]